MATVSAEVTPEVRTIHRLTAAFIAVAIVALAIANVPALFQAFDRAGINLYPYARPVIRTYYQGLTIHGVMNVLVWTIFFLSRFFSFVTVYALGRPLASMRLGWAAFWIMLAGLVMALIPIFANTATVLYTFYPPLKASPLFYIGLTLIVVGTWLIGWNILQTWRGWRRDNPGERTPLAVFGTLATYALWTIASVGLAIEMLFLLIPWSFGIIDTVDPLLARTLFWFTGHPIVYFWLLPAYVSWYTMVPRLAGGHLFSEPMARIAFLLFVLYSIPVGLHHQFSDPGLGGGIKLVHTFMTFAVFFPSLLTYFNISASIETAARLNGGTGWIRWVRNLPWGNPAFTGQVMGMFLFVPGGIGGLTNASYNVNQAVHNTTWVVGHFHLTVGGAVTLTFMATTYWLIPYLTGRALWGRRLAVAQPIIFFVGMTIWSETMHRLGLEYMPRRTFLSQAPYAQGEWDLERILLLIGGPTMFVAGVLYFVIIIMTLVASRQPARVQVPLPRPGEEGSHERVPKLLDSWRPWLIGSAVLIAIAYLPVFTHLLRNVSSVPGFAGIW
ncbi:cbb3-type cytochrome c oxidase subunit I [Sphaerobacter thermophilus]|uniref:Cytochrome-c oxidase n=1 Tax=Sphaerobacter thermophilus (strain ATCC 49802 / DSM 20745 / KCCM 41009 / NCIMB 13125 / S 6022) TaxID=479434 RepID=D1C4V2_SPHTD|nr:cbb3-type cytochrome c oxidase subunit I [Sphaerobacter thermophilus]ACZ39269.1 Cytochrome-c oxidase [Sphaerobacter thermophilus DSM 20745]